LGINWPKTAWVNRPDLGKGVEGGACWDLGVYMSECSNTLVDDGTGKGTMVGACVKGTNTLASGRWLRHGNNGEGVREG
jgi:hypothetical protein